MFPRQLSRSLGDSRIHLIDVHQNYTLVPEVILEPRENGEDQTQSGEKRKTSFYLGLESLFHADARCQTRQIDNYKRD